MAKIDEQEIRGAVGDSEQTSHGRLPGEKRLTCRFVSSRLISFRLVSCAERARLGQTQGRYKALLTPTAPVLLNKTMTVPPCGAR